MDTTLLQVFGDRSFLRQRCSGNILIMMQADANPPYRLNTTLQCWGDVGDTFQICW